MGNHLEKRKTGAGKSNRRKRNDRRGGRRLLFCGLQFFFIWFFYVPDSSKKQDHTIMPDVYYLIFVRLFSVSLISELAKRGRKKLLKITSQNLKATGRCNEPYMKNCMQLPGIHALQGGGTLCLVWQVYCGDEGCLHVVLLVRAGHTELVPGRAHFFSTYVSF